MGTWSVKVERVNIYSECGRILTRDVAIALHHENQVCRYKQITGFSAGPSLWFKPLQERVDVMVKRFLKQVIVLHGEHLTEEELNDLITALDIRAKTRFDDGMIQLQDVLRDPKK